MKQFARTIAVILLTFLWSDSIGQVLINADVQIDGFRHNHDCGNDGALADQPDPRYKVWVGYNNANFNALGTPPGLYSGCGNTYGADGISCSVWNPGIINAASYSALPLTQINIDMQSWEEDGCGSNCDANTCTFNSDDTRCGRLRIGDVDFWNQGPCQDNIYVGDFTSGSFLSMHNRCGDNNGAGYGIDNLIINWSFAEAPTITSQPSPADQTLCPGNSTTLTVGVNSFNGWSLAQYVQWQISTSTDCGSATGWTDIAGANS
ncbi:MAG: hypothetical protein ACPG8K_03910, partial [Crocinitomicaceae bacterium]